MTTADSVLVFPSHTKQNTMAPETHTRYRVQHLIRRGEFLEDREPAVKLAIDSIDEAQDLLLDPPEGMTCSDQVELAGFKMMYALEVLNRFKSDRV